MLLEINGRRPRDVLDVMQWGDGSSLSLRLKRGEQVLKAKLHKQEGSPLGLVFDEPVFDGVMVCRNRCIFCFVDRMPSGMRPSLYLKDDDYRLSFLHGNFITLNNIPPREVKRIIELRLSPLYVSLHTTDPSLRERMMGRGGRRGLEVLAILMHAGIEVHLQVVCCPGVNDGPELERTFSDVLRRYPAASLGVVPVGITRYRPANVPHLPLYDARSSCRVLETVAKFQERGMVLYGRRLFHAADEFYLLAGRDFPPAVEYEGFPQLENGVGMARKFLDEASACPVPRDSRPRYGVLTGAAGKPVIDRLLREKGMDGVEVIPVTNRLFGETVTVTSLLGGRDIVECLRERPPSTSGLLVPATLLREGRFLDDLTLEQVEEESGRSLLPVEVEGGAFLHSLLGEKKS